MKAILQSIKPQYCELIAAGKKTIEVRKSKPKLKTPFKCYIYCTKDNKVKFWKSKTYAYADDRNHNAFDKCCNGTVIGEFICDYIEEYKPVIPPAIKGYTEYQMSLQTLCEDIHLSIRDIVNYGKGKTLYGWHISNLVIYDKPKELSEFIYLCPKYTKERFTKKMPKVSALF